jgi:hypothetical protein
MMNDRGLEVWGGVIITCAKTGEIWSVERRGDPELAHAEINSTGRISFVMFDPDGMMEHTMH